MARIDEKNVASVKKTVSVAAPTGGIKLSAYDKAAGAKFVKGGVADRAATAQGRGGTLTKVSTPVKGGQTMGGKATAAQGKGGQTMGQKAATAQGKGGPIVQAIKEKLTGKPAAAAAAPEKEEPLKLSTFNLPTVVRVGNQGYDPKEVFGVAKKIEQTYGRDSQEFRSFATGVGLSPSANGGYGFPGTNFKKPDLRKDTKSYVDTAQKQYGITQNPMQARSNLVGFGGNKASIQDASDVGRFVKFANTMLEEFGAKPGKRILATDPKSVEKESWGGQQRYWDEYDY